MGYSCDLCRVGVHVWDFVFECDNGFMHTHDLCLGCVANVIRINAKLKELLREQLSDEMSVDCIDTIVSFVIGNVVYCEKNHQSASTKKRRLESPTLPQTKRQKVKHTN